MVGKAYPPESFVVVCRDWPVSRFTMETAAPGIGASLGSLILPTIDPYSTCACAGKIDTSRAPQSPTAMRNILPPVLHPRSDSAPPCASVRRRRTPFLRGPHSRSPISLLYQFTRERAVLYLKRDQSQAPIHPPLVMLCPKVPIFRKSRW